MTSAVAADPSADHTDLPHLLRASVPLGVVHAVLVGAFAATSRLLEGPLELAIHAAILVVGIAVSIALPGLWTKARGIEGIAGAAGIGLAATWVFMLIDVVVLQPLGIYSNRWLEIGGGSNWWYHPIWWMVGTYLPWMGAWVLANQASKAGAANPVVLVGGTLVVAALIAAAATVLNFPGAAFGLGTWGVAVLPALAVMVLVTGLGNRRG